MEGARLPEPEEAEGVVGLPSLARREAGTRMLVAGEASNDCCHCDKVSKVNALP